MRSLDGRDMGGQGNRLNMDEVELIQVVGSVKSVVLASGDYLISISSSLRLIPNPHSLTPCSS